MKRLLSLVCLPVLAWSANASAEEPRVHVAGGGARAVGGDQQSEYATGGAGSASLELPATSRLGFQASAGAIVLSKGQDVSDASLASKSTGAAFLGTLGVRLRGYGATKVAGPWVDANGGMARTGDLNRPVFEAHVGWDFRVSHQSRVDVGPFVGYTQIFQSDSELRGSDARVLVAGLSISLGKKEGPKPSEPAGKEAPPPLPLVPTIIDHDAFAESWDVCPDGDPPSEEGCVNEVRMFEDRILVDNIHFAFDSAWIRESSARAVRNVARFILQHPDIVDISIEGHADEVGTDDYNQKLSEARARSMREALIRQGVEASRLRVRAYGKSRPKVVTLKKEEQNRRVELFVTREREATTKGVASTHGRTSK